MKTGRPTTKPGRKRVTFNLPPEDMEKLKRIAQAQGISASELLHQTIEKLARENMEQQARERINEMDFTDEQVDFIFSDWPNWDEHITWLMTASREEIISWIDASK